MHPPVPVKTSFYCSVSVGDLCYDCVLMEFFLNRT